MVSICSLEERPELIGQLRAFLNLSLERDFISREFFNRVILEDPNQESKYILFAFEKRELVGTLIGVRRIKAPSDLVKRDKEVAWIKILAIHPMYRTHEIFTKLLNEFESLVRDYGIKRIRVCDFASWYFSPGLDIQYEYYLDMFLRERFRKVGECVNYELDMMYFHVPQRIIKVEELLKRNGVTFREAKQEDRNRVVKWVYENFSSCWAYETELGFEREEAGVWIAENAKKDLLGFSVYGALESSWFGPIGVSEKVRGRGIGSVLLYKCLLSLRALGRRYVIIPWTGHLFFYSQLSIIKEVRHYWKMEKQLSS